MLFALLGGYCLLLFGNIYSERKQQIRAMYFIGISFIIIALIAGLRRNIGDTYVYIQGYEQFAGLSFEKAMEGKGDIGFYILTYILYQINSDPQFMILIVALLTQLMNFKFFLQYRSYLELELYVYIASGFYFVSMNGMRQSLAAGVVILSTKYIVNGNFKKFLLMTLLAAALHQSAIIMLPIYFICRCKAWSKKVFLLMFFALIGTGLFYELLPILERVVEGTNYAHYIKVFMEGTEEGANILRVAVSCIPCILAYMIRDSLEDNMFNRVFINMSVINLIFMIFSIQTWIFARFSIYFNLYNCILLGYLIKKWPSEKERKYLYGGLIICYLIFFVHEQRFAQRIRF